MLKNFSWFFLLDRATPKLSIETKNRFAIFSALVPFSRGTSHIDTFNARFQTSPYTSEFYWTLIHFWTFNISQIITVKPNNFYLSMCPKFDRNLRKITSTSFLRLFILNIENQKFHFLTKICEIRNKRWNSKLFAQLNSAIVFPYWDIWQKIHFFWSCKLLESYRNVYFFMHNFSN